MEIDFVARFSSLGHPQRLAIFRLLARRYPDTVPAGEIAKALRCPNSTVSAYLSSLMHVGLIQQVRVGTSVQYALDPAAMQETIEYLTLDCCRGRPALCEPTQHEAPFRVLFLCSGNSARSIFAEALLRDLGHGRFLAVSAGTHPAQAPHPMALEILRANGHDTRDLRSKGTEDLIDGPSFDFVLTVCDAAANEECPAWPGQPISAHWGLPDPVKAQGTPAEIALAFRTTYKALRQRIEAFVALPVETLPRLSLQTALDTLATETHGDA